MPQKKKQYITEEDQNEMYNLMNSYLQLSKNGTVTNKHADILAHRLFSQYVDKMIMGMINSRKYVFWLYPDPDELFQEARIAVLSSIWSNIIRPLNFLTVSFFGFPIQVLFWFVQSKPYSRGEPNELYEVQIKSRNVLEHYGLHE